MTGYCTPIPKATPKTRKAKGTGIELAFPKDMRNVITRGRQHTRAPYCELCGKWGPVERHHIRTRKAGGGDEAENTIDICYECHHGKVPSGKVSAETLYDIAQAREAYKLEHGVYKWEEPDAFSA